MQPNAPFRGVMQKPPLSTISTPHYRLFKLDHPVSKVKRACQVLDSTDCITILAYGRFIIRSYHYANSQSLLTRLLPAA